MLKRNHKGIEGYFYKSGNKKLVVQPAIIEKMVLKSDTFSNCSEESDRNIGVLYIAKRGHTFPVFELPQEDITSFFRDYGVSNEQEFNKLQVQERLVFVYNHRGVNYGISVPSS